MMPPGLGILPLCGMGLGWSCCRNHVKRVARRELPRPLDARNHGFNRAALPLRCGACAGWSTPTEERSSASRSTGKGLARWPASRGRQPYGIAYDDIRSTLWDHADRHQPTGRPALKAHRSPRAPPTTPSASQHGRRRPGHRTLVVTGSTPGGLVAADQALRGAPRAGQTPQVANEAPTRTKSSTGRVERSGQVRGGGLPDRGRP